MALQILDISAQCVWASQNIPAAQCLKVYSVGLFQGVIDVLDRTLVLLKVGINHAFNICGPVGLDIFLDFNDRFTIVIRAIIGKNQFDAWIVLLKDAFNGFDHTVESLICDYGKRKQLFLRHFLPVPQLSFDSRRLASQSQNHAGQQEKHYDQHQHSVQHCRTSKAMGLNHRP